MNIDKVLVTHKKALRGKYGNQGLAAIQKAVEGLIAADGQRGIETRLVFLDLAGDMNPLEAPRITESGDPQQTKEAVDGVFEALSPDYLVLLGAPDVLPHQILTNPLTDDDLDLPSDLPYACDAPFSKDPADFTAPSRVVGRLPGIQKSKDFGYLVKLLENAADWKSYQRRSYTSHFAVSADVWKDSTRQTVRKLFNTTSRLELSPSEGPNWPKSKLTRRNHFFNLHGALGNDNFFGELDFDYPVAHLASHLVGRIRSGTVATAECCYGAELYDPLDLEIHMGIANTYLGEGAYGFFGSTNVAYGPAAGNGYADLICQFFVREVLAGASLGRATLMARQAYVALCSPLDPTDLKTLAQFHLLGDASIHPSSSPPKPRPRRRRRSRRRARKPRPRACPKAKAGPWANPSGRAACAAGRCCAKPGCSPPRSPRFGPRPRSGSLPSSSPC